MIEIRDRDHEKMWDSIHTLSNVDEEQAKAVLKAIIELSLHKIGMLTPYVSRIPLKLPDKDYIHWLKGMENEVREKLSQKEDDAAYELLVEYIYAISNLAEGDSSVFQKQLIASLLKQGHQQQKGIRIVGKQSSSSTGPAVTFSKEEDTRSHFTPSEVSKRLGVSDQTVRRMCDKGKFPGAFQTDGGHWKIPKHALITTQEEDQRAEQLFQQIDAKNKKAGDVDEYDL